MCALPGFRDIAYAKETITVLAFNKGHRTQSQH